MDRAQHRWVTLKGMYEEAGDSMEAKAYEQEGLIKYLELLAGNQGEKEGDRIDREVIAKVEKIGAEIKAFYDRTVEPLFKEM